MKEYNSNNINEFFEDLMNKPNAKLNMLRVYGAYERECEDNNRKHEIKDKYQVLPQLIDEWQEVPEIWDAVRFAVDKNGEKGKFILTGSSTPKRKGILHSGAGRIGRIRMNTMSLFELGDSKGQVRLMDLFEDKLKPIATGEVQLEQLIQYTVRGG